MFFFYRQATDTLASFRVSRHLCYDPAHRVELKAGSKTGAGKAGPKKHPRNDFFVSDEVARTNFDAQKSIAPKRLKYKEQMKKVKWCAKEN